MITYYLAAMFLLVAYKNYVLEGGWRIWQPNGKDFRNANAIYRAGRLPAKPQRTERLLKMIAAIHGKLWNATQIGQSLGITEGRRQLGEIC